MREVRVRELGRVTGEESRRPETTEQVLCEKE